MNRIEAFMYLVEFPNKKLKVLKYFDGAEATNEFIGVEANGQIVYSAGSKVNFYIDDKAEFEVVRELRKMSFGEAIVKSRENKELLNSIVTNSAYASNDKDIIFLRDDMLEGKWTVEGIYED